MTRIREQIGWLISKTLYEWNPLKRRRQRRFYRQFISPGDWCFDVGAHMGDRTATWLELGANVLAVEPNPRFANYLEKKFARNPDFRLLPAALGAAPGTAELWVSHMYPTLSSLAGQQWADDLAKASPLAVRFDEKIQVEVQTLDALVARYGLPTFCKIDVEGFEEQVLAGLSHRIPALSFEFLSFNQPALQQSLRRLDRFGYRDYNWSYRERFKMELPEWTRSDQVCDSISSFGTGVYSGDVYARFSADETTRRPALTSASGSDRSQSIG